MYVDYYKPNILMIYNILKSKENFHKLILAKVSHSIAYSLCRKENVFIDKIVDIANYGYYNANKLSLICFFDDKQISFLKLSRLGYFNEEDFNKFKNNIVEKAFFEQLIDVSNFYIKYSPEPSNKKIKVNL
jgi:hypothetical protein